MENKIQKLEPEFLVWMKHKNSFDDELKAKYKLCVPMVY